MLLTETPQCSKASPTVVRSIHVGLDMEPRSLLTELLVPTYEAKPETPQRSPRAGERPRDPVPSGSTQLSIVSHWPSY